MSVPIPLGAGQAPYQAVSSGLLSATGVVYAGPALLVAVIVYPAAADSSAIIADGEGGTVLAKAVAAASDLPNGENHIFTPAQTGLYLTLAGAAAAVLVRYIPLPTV